MNRIEKIMARRSGRVMFEKQAGGIIALVKKTGPDPGRGGA